MRIPSLFATALLLASSLPTGAQQTAETIYYHGDILTGVGLNTTAPERVTALAIRDGKILATGRDALLQQYKSEQAELIDLHGAFVMPGFNDAHVHLGEAGEEKLHVDLVGSTSLDDMLARIHKAALSALPAAWLQGGGWDHTLWSSKTLPTRADLDRVTAGHPAIFTRVDGHIAVADTAALNAAEITPNTADPQGGKIDRDKDGDVTGILREDPAMELVWTKIPPPSPEEQRRAITLSTEDAVCHGLTSAQDNSGWGYFLAMEAMEHDGTLPLRISEWLPFDAPVDQLKQMRAHHAADDPMLHTAMLKGFMDGSLGSRTAAMNAPYTDEPANSGLPRYQQPKLNAMAQERTDAGFQLGFHAIGDRAVDMALIAFSNALCPSLHPGATSTCVSTADRRFRIEHSQVISPGDFTRYKNLGIIASMQPNHLLTDMHWAEQRIGPERAKYAYAWKSFLDHGVVLAFGTDYPVEPITPFRGVYSAVTRMDEAQTMTFQPQEKLTINQALYAYTQGSAFAQFAEKRKGQLAPGFLADFVVLDRDLTKIPPHDILATHVLRTVVAGKVRCEDGKLKR